MKLKKIYHVSVEVFGEQDFFFDENGKLLTYWDGNDASWRGEYMNPLLKKLGFQVVEADYKKFAKQIKEILIDMGASEEDFEN